MLRRAALTALLLICLSACGSGATKGTGGSSTQEAAPSQPQFTTLNDLAAAIGCTKYAPQDAMLFASETGDCKGTNGVGQVTMNLFNNDASRDKYVDVGISNGAVYVIGDGWLVECETRTQQDAVASATDGIKKG